jgi:hypothetical protein
MVKGPQGRICNYHTTISASCWTPQRAASIIDAATKAKVLNGGAALEAVAEGRTR